MKLIVGLGNPGRKYEQTRHNVGFMVVDLLARRWSVDADGYNGRFEAQVGEAQRGGRRVLLLRPQTFMNLSGRSVLAVQRFYKVPLEDVLIVCDDLDLPPGRIRLRARGSGGGHNGLTDVIGRLGSPEIPRLRIGIGKVSRYVTTGHVLGAFCPEEREAIDEAIVDAADAVECWLARGIDRAMTAFNRRPKENDEKDGPKGDPQ